MTMTLGWGLSERTVGLARRSERAAPPLVTSRTAKMRVVAPRRRKESAVP